mmetsp:Transcript_133723/g.198803  ORF Transcript_133723/g.198803 Transcript_133723/m.198803 type:complete len:327 (-) Transcript_133723:66-1046(-)
MSIARALFVSLCVSCHAGQLRRRPLKLRYAQNAQVDYEKRILMAWTPRAACSTAMELWALHLGLHEQAMASRWIHDWRVDVLDKMTNGMEAQLTDLLNPILFKMKVVMNPFHRAVTMYQHALLTSWYQRLCPGLREGIQQLNGPQDVQNVTFVEFLRLQRTAQDLILRCPTSAEHLAMQTAVLGGKVWTPDYVCRIEELENCVAYMSTVRPQEWKMPPRDSHVASQHNTVRVDVQGEAASMGFLQYNNQYPKAEAYYAGESGSAAVELVRELYAPDFDYGYDRSRPDNFAAFEAIELGKHTKMAVDMPTPEEQAAAEAGRGIVMEA